MTTINPAMPAREPSIADCPGVAFRWWRETIRIDLGLPQVTGAPTAEQKQK